MLWHSPRHPDFALRDWEDGSALHDAASGQLHFLNSAAALILRHFLAGQSWSAGTLARQLFETEPTAEDLALVEEQLGQLQQLKLIAPLAD